MSHYQERLEKDLSRIRESVQTLSERVQEALKNAVHALLTGNGELAYRTVLGDGPINRVSRHIDQLCHSFIALHLPSAGHLRLMSAVIRTNIALERIGDYACTICRESVQLSSPPDGTVAREVELMAEESRRMLHQAVTAFQEGNAEGARGTMGMADQVERTFDTVFADLLAEEGRRRVKDLFGLLVVFNALERVSDQAKNICEETVFAVTGEAKAAKVYNVLFIDEDNSCQSQMAEAMARKSFPHAGRYTSAGRQPAPGLNAALASFLAERGIDLGGVKPKRLDFTQQELGEYEVIVSLQGPVRNYVPQIPFHSIALEWDVGPAPVGADEAQSRQRCEEMYREIALRLRDLMEHLRGEEAA